jgi:hypothetical protein
MGRLVRQSVRLGLTLRQEQAKSGFGTGISSKWARRVIEDRQTDVLGGNFVRMVGPKAGNIVETILCMQHDCPVKKSAMKRREQNVGFAPVG